MSDWRLAQDKDTQRLAQVHTFSMIRKQGEQEIEFLITVKEYITPAVPTMRFFAQSDKYTNQKGVPFLPSGWGNSLLTALSECMRAVEKFPYEGD